MNDITPEPRSCEVCGDPIRRDNRYGICQRNTECARAYHRKRSPANPEWRGANFIDRTGQRFGKLVVVCRAEDRPRPALSERNFGKKRSARVQWLCLCDCGKEKIIAANNLISGGVISCGCAKRTPHPAYRPKNLLPPGRAARNQVQWSYRGHAQRKGISWELADEQFDAIICGNCTYCGCPPGNVTRSKALHSSSEWVYNGIDRVDSALGYTPGNVVPCCETCNKAKRDLSYDEFMAWIARLTEYHWFHPDAMPSRLLREAGKSA